MKDFLSELIELLSSCVLIICLALASFLFVLNIYHFKEVRYNQIVNMNEDEAYIEYKSLLKNIDKKMNSVDYNNVKYGSTAKPIHDYYEKCKTDLSNGTYEKFESQDSVSPKNIYDANDEILKVYNRSCVFGIPYNITVIGKGNKLDSSYKSLYKLTEQKRQIIIDNADYLTKSGLGNSSYSFSTDVSRSGVNNRLYNETRLTINNYKMMASILNDVADWYVDEFGGNR